MENKTTKKDTAKDVKEIITKEDNSKDEVFYEEKEKGRVLRIIWNVIFYSALAVFAFCAILILRFYDFSFSYICWRTKNGYSL